MFLHMICHKDCTHKVKQIAYNIKLIYLMVIDIEWKYYKPLMQNYQKTKKFLKEKP